MSVFSVYATDNLSINKGPNWHEISNLSKRIQPIEHDATDKRRLYDVLVTLNLPGVLLDGSGHGRLFVGIQINGNKGWYDYSETSYQATGANHNFLVQAHFVWDNISELSVQGVWGLVTGTMARVKSKYTKPSLIIQLSESLAKPDELPPVPPPFELPDLDFRPEPQPDCGHPEHGRPWHHCP